MGLLGVPGVLNIAQQTIVAPTGTNAAVRVFCVNFGSTTTNTSVTLNNVGSGTTATALGTNPILRVHDEYTGTGSFHCGRGVLFTDGVKIHTSTGFTFATIVYSTEFY